MLRFPALIFLGLLAAAGAEAAPRRVVSTNLCADQLVLLLADRDQIVSLSRTAFEPALSNVVAEAKGIQPNHQRAEEIMALKPDLVISSRYRELAVNAMLVKLGIKVSTVPSPESLAETRQVIRSLSRLLGHPERGEAMVAKMDQRLQALGPRDAARPKTIIYQANGGTIGTKTLSGELISRAGLHNMAGELGVERWGSLSLEQVIVANPDLMIFETDGQLGHSLAQMAQQHPLFRALRANHVIGEIPSRLWDCPGPWNVDAVELLVKARRHFLESGTKPAKRAGAGA